MLIDRYRDKVYNTALGMVQSAEDAEDIAQEVFIEVFESIAGFKGDSRLTTWIYRITITKSFDHLRRKKRKKRFAIIRSLFDPLSPADEPADFIHPGVQMENRERAAILFRAIDRLSENQRIAFTLHKVEGLSYLEVAEVMGVTVSSVESLMHRARANLRKMLAEYYRAGQ